MSGFPFARFTLCAALTSLILAPLLFLGVSSCALSGSRAFVLSSSHAKKIAAIEIAIPHAEYPIRLERKKASWYLVLDDTHRYPANTPRVSSFIETVRQARASRVLDQNDGAYGIDTNTSPRIRALTASGTVLLDLVAGNATVAGTSQYFFDGLVGRTIRMEPPLSGFIEGTTAFWADLSPFRDAFQGREIERVIYKKGNYQRALVRGSSVNGTEAINSLERGLSSLSCVDVTNIPFTATESITFELGDTSSVTISIMQVNENYAIIRRESDGASWVIAETAHTALIGSF
jgi:hypothetical protein